MNIRSLASAVPATTWLPHYRADWLRPDLVAGLTLAAYLLPAGIGDASLAGLPPEAGLYACLFSGLVFWIFCSSRQTVITVTSALSLLVGSAAGELSAGDPGRHAALAAAMALMVAGIALAAWAVRAGSAVGFFSETVLVGFKAGLALYLASTQLPKLFGFAGSHGDFWERTGHFLRGLDQTNATALVFGITALAALTAGKLWLKNRPVAFLVVIGGIVAARLANVETRGVALLGNVPQGLPAIGLPVVSRADLNALMPAALACFVLATVETSAIGRMFAQKHGGRLDANQELLALGGANLLAGLGRGFPVSGGMSQSLVNEIGVLGSGPANGVLLGAALSIVLLLRQGARPRVTELAPVAGTIHFADAVRHPENRPKPGVLVVRCESALLYFNVDHVRDRFYQLLDRRKDEIHLVIFFLGSVPNVDLAGAELLSDLNRTVSARGIAFRLAEARGTVRDALRRSGYEQAFGLLASGQTIDVVLAEWQPSAATAGAGS